MRRLLYRAFSSLGSLHFAAFKQAASNFRATQESKLLTLLTQNSHCAFGQDHSFAKIKSISDFQKAVPIRDYEGHYPYIQRALSGESSVLTTANPQAYVTTSGTTGNRKFIPVTDNYLKEFRQASVISGLNLLKAYPGIAQGVTVSVVSPAVEGVVASGIPYGAISGQLFLKESFLMRKFIAPIPYPVYLLPDYESRYYTILRLALNLPLSLLYTLNPSTLMLLMQKLQIHKDQLIKDAFDGTITPPGQLPAATLAAIQPFLIKNPERARYLEKLSNANQFVAHKVWPKLSVVACWTAAAASFYLADFPEFFGNVPVSDITYGASEGRGTVFIEPGKEALAVLSHFFEFIAENEIDKANPTVLLGNELTPGTNYFILFTTAAGLYRYNINDVVKCIGYYQQTPLLQFQYKGGNVCSFTGEKLTELQVTEAMKRTAQELKLHCRYFTLLPQFRPQPHYVLWVEADQSTNHDPINTALIARVFDQHLCALNSEYETKRASQRLGRIMTSTLLPGSYESYRKYLTANGAPDSQIKISHLNPKAETQEYFAYRIMETVA